MIQLDQTHLSNVSYVLVSSTDFYTLCEVEILLLRWIKKYRWLVSKFDFLSAEYNKTMVKARRFVLARTVVGFPKESDFRLEEEELPALKDGGR